MELRMLSLMWIAMAGMLSLSFNIAIIYFLLSIMKNSKKQTALLEKLLSRPKD